MSDGMLVKIEGEEFLNVDDEQGSNWIQARRKKMALIQKLKADGKTDEEIENVLIKKGLL